MKKNIHIILFIIALIALFGALTLNNIRANKLKEENKEEEKYIEMDAVVSYSCEDYTIFSTAEFTSFLVFGEPIRDYYDTVILTINTKNTSITSDDEAIRVEDRDPQVINSSGGDIYENK